MIGRRTMVGGAVAAGAVGATTVAVAMLDGNHATASRVTVLDPVAAPRLSDVAAMVRVSPVKPAPAVRFADASGRSMGLSDYAGHGVVLNLWATWCSPCVAEMPSLAALARGAAVDGFVVLPVSIDHAGAATVVPWLARHGIDLPALLDPQSLAAGLLGIRGVPTTFVIDRAGDLRGLLEGGADWSTEAARATVRSLIA